MIFLGKAGVVTFQWFLPQVSLPQLQNFHQKHMGIHCTSRFFQRIWSRSKCCYGPWLTNLRAARQAGLKNIPCKIVKYSKTKGLFDNNYWTFNKSSKWSGLLSFWASSNPIDPFSEVAIVYPLLGLAHWSSCNFESHCSSISSLCQHINITYGLTTLWPPKKVMFFNPHPKNERKTRHRRPLAKAQQSFAHGLLIFAEALIRRPVGSETVD